MSNFNQDVSVDFDNLSVAENSSVMYYTDMNRAARTAANEFNTLKRIFGTHDDFSAYSYNEELILAIRHSREIDWNEISEISDLPEFIMDDFSDKLKWKILFFNRRMTKKTMKLFRSHLIKVINSDDFIMKLNDSNTHVLDIVLNLNDKLIPNVFAHGYTNSHGEIIERLFDNPSITKSMTNEAMRSACKNGHFEIVKLLENDPRIDNLCFSIKFHEACKKGHLEIVKSLVNDPRIANDDFCTGFQSACRNGHTEIVKSLVNDPRIANDDFGNEFYWACQNDHLDVVKLLVNYPRIDNNYFSVGFHEACKNGHLEIVKSLVDDPRITYYSKNKIEFNGVPYKSEIVTLLKSKLNH